MPTTLHLNCSFIQIFRKGKAKKSISRPDTYDETFHSFLKLCPSTFLFRSTVTFHMLRTWSVTSLKKSWPRKNSLKIRIKKWLLQVQATTRPFPFPMSRLSNRLLKYNSPFFIYTRQITALISLQMDSNDETFHSFLKLCSSTFLFQLSRFTCVIGIVIKKILAQEKFVENKN